MSSLFPFIRSSAEQHIPQRPPKSNHLRCRPDGSLKSICAQIYLPTPSSSSISHHAAAAVSSCSHSHGSRSNALRTWDTQISEHFTAMRVDSTRPFHHSYAGFLAIGRCLMFTTSWAPPGIARWSPSCFSALGPPGHLSKMFRDHS